MTTMNAGDIFVALQQRHPAPEWVFLPQVRTRTGYSRSYGSDFDSERYLDAFAINCFASKGYRRVGYEIKVSRGDWLRELEDPRKRAQGFFLCHQFWFAVAPGVYLPADEGGLTIGGRTWRNPLDTCGVLEVQSDGALKELKRATTHEAWPMPDTFVASLLRSYVSAACARAATPAQVAVLNGVTEDETERAEAQGATPHVGLWTLTSSERA